MDNRRLTAVASAVCLAVLALAVLAPLVAPFGSYVRLDGTPGMIDGGWRGGGPFDFMYALGDVVCHQEAARSFVLNGSQLPLCMRCTGILAGLAFGFVVCTALGSQAGDRRIAVVGAVLVVVMAAEWAVETTGFDSPVLRALSGVSAGAGASLFLGWLAYMEHDWVSR